MRRQEFERRAFPILLWVIIVLVKLAVVSRYMPCRQCGQPSASPTATTASKSAPQ